jgi:hypothetical protein
MTIIDFKTFYFILSKKNISDATTSQNPWPPISPSRLPLHRVYPPPLPYVPFPFYSSVPSLALILSSSLLLSLDFVHIVILLDNEILVVVL